MTKGPGKLTKHLLIIAGTLFVGLGIIGIFLPLIPTTPLLLLAAACYARSSERIYNRLLGNPLFGEYIRNYREGKGVPLRVKGLTICLLWLTIILSTVFFLDHPYIRIILLVVAIGVTVHIARVRTMKAGDKPPPDRRR